MVYLNILYTYIYIYIYIYDMYIVYLLSDIIQGGHVQDILRLFII